MDTKMPNKIIKNKKIYSRWVRKLMKNRNISQIHSKTFHMGIQSDISMRSSHIHWAEV